uniref:Uncharacterized protein n=1 Tax=Arundo donax TaxID=35708 RepID=A0A0A8ZR93_ARUDO
MMANTKVTEKD